MVSVVNRLSCYMGRDFPRVVLTGRWGPTLLVKQVSSAQTFQSCVADSLAIGGLAACDPGYAPFALMVTPDLGGPTKTLEVTRSVPAGTAVQLTTATSYASQALAMWPAVNSALDAVRAAGYQMGDVVLPQVRIELFGERLSELDLTCFAPASRVAGAHQFRMAPDWDVWTSDYWPDGERPEFGPLMDCGGWVLDRCEVTDCPGLRVVGTSADLAKVVSDSVYVPVPASTAE